MAPLRAAANAENLKKPDGPRKLYVGNLHPNINEIMLKAVFEPFGMVSSVCRYVRTYMAAVAVYLSAIADPNCASLCTRYLG